MSAEEIANNSDESWRNIYRFIKLTNLIPELLNKVDERKLAFIPVVELSYLTKEEQGWLYDILSREEKFGVPLKQASKLKGIAKEENLLIRKFTRFLSR